VYRVGRLDGVRYVPPPGDPEKPPQVAMLRDEDVFGYR